MTVDQLIAQLKRYAMAHPLNAQAEVGVQFDNVVFNEFDARAFTGPMGAILAFVPNEKGGRYTMQEVRLDA